MKLLFSCIAAALTAALATGVGHADDTAQVGRRTVRVGEQFALVLEVETVAGATVEIDPLAPSWQGVEVVQVTSDSLVSRGSMVVHRLELVAAAFMPGATGFAPAVVVVSPEGAVPRVLPPIELAVSHSLDPDDPLELSVLLEPGATSGGEAPWLRPAVVAGVTAGVGLLAVALYVCARWGIRRLRRRPEVELGEGAPTPGLVGAEGLLEFDPVRAYRMMGQTVRVAVAERYGLPAVALTTSEIGTRMEGAGVDRWVTRLVSGLLQECDAVVYAGYRPAAERRLADLNIAREILEVSG